MATILSKPVAREVVSGGKWYVVTMTHAGITIREKGKRTTFGPVSWGLIFVQGAKFAAAAHIHEREQKREERGGRKRRHHVSRGLLSLDGR